MCFCSYQMSQCGYMDELSIHSKVRNDRYVMQFSQFINNTSTTSSCTTVNTQCFPGVQYYSVYVMFPWSIVLLFIRNVSLEYCTTVYTQCFPGVVYYCLYVVFPWSSVLLFIRSVSLEYCTIVYTQCFPGVLYYCLYVMFPWSIVILF